MDDHDENVDGGAPPLILPTILEFYSRLLGYVVVLGILYLMATRCAAAVEDTAPKRPVLRPGLMVDEDEGDNGDEETDDEDEGHVVEEIDTDEMIKGDGTRNRKAKKAAALAAQSGPFPKELNPLTYKQPENEKVSFRDLHNAMLNRYKHAATEILLARYSLLSGVLHISSLVGHGMSTTSSIECSVTEGQAMLLLSVSLLSLCGCLYVIVTYMYVPALRQHPAGIMFGMSVYGAVYQFMYIVESHATPSAACRDVPFIVDFFLTGQETYMLIFAIDLLLALKNPFTASKGQMNRYHIAGCVLIFAGISRCDNHFALFGFCWMDVATASLKDKSSARSPPAGLFFALYILLIYTTSLYAILRTWNTLLKGLPDTFTTRDRTDRHIKYTQIEEIPLSCSATSSAATVVFYDYAPHIFRFLRSCANISNASYRDSLQQTTKERVSEGKSGAFFYFTQDRKYVVKTLTHEELKFLLQILPKYVTVFDTRLPIHERFDLKGSWVGRLEGRKTRGTAAMCKFCGNEYIIGGSHDQLCDVRSNNGTLRHQYDNVGKDLNWNHHVKLPRPVAAQVAKQLHTDSTFLSQINCIDYSLLVGIHHRTFHVGGDAMATNTTTNTALDESPRYATSLDSDESPLYETSFHHGGMGVEQVYGPGVYFVGLIDILQQWNVRKRLEHFVRVYLCGQDRLGISVVAPHEYADRFQKRVVRDLIHDLHEVPPKRHRPRPSMMDEENGDEEVDEASSFASDSTYDTGHFDTFLSVDPVTPRSSLNLFPMLKRPEDNATSSRRRPGGKYAMEQETTCHRMGEDGPTNEARRDEEYASMQTPQGLAMLERTSDSHV
ncbi:hypothetical protein DYB34_003374 [Aphanomyces astaci]|uniref:PIPK domain-containing protein n=1 Tax=Aphanomyces astaci TaxID=112090 RepID=A0A418C2W4_APHAT|nr:hypothetical protein DYB34_003374 [Aphanomyces astaci]